METGLITVGDELLAGDTVNTNAAWLAEQLFERGVSMRRISTVPDEEAAIAGVIDRYRQAYDAVVVTGGLGPTHDDLTMAAVARALDRELAVDESAVAWLAGERGYERADLAAGTAEMPVGAEPLHNTVGVAPGCIVDGVYVFPGVPSEMQAMFGAVADRFDGPTQHVVVVETTEAESALVDRFEAVQAAYDIKLGSYPGETVSIRIEGEQDTVERAAGWLRERVELAAGSITE